MEPLENPIDTSLPTLPLAGEILSKTKNFYQKKFRLFWRIMLWPFVFGLPFTAISGMIDQKHPEAFFTRFPLFQQPAFHLLYFVSIIVFSLISIFSQLAILYVVTHPETVLSPAEYYRRSRTLFWLYLGLNLLSGLLIAGATFLFLIPGLLFAFWFMFAPYILLEQGVKGSRALALSREYAKGYVWKIIGRLLLAIAVYIVVLIIQNLVTEGIIFILRPFIGEHVMLFNALRALSSFALGLAASPFIIAYQYFLYRGLVAIKGPNIASSQPRLPAKYSALAVLGWIFFFALAIILPPLVLRQVSETRPTNQLDLLTVQVPLSGFRTAQGHYPQHLAELVPDFIKEFPPSFQDEKNYQYTADSNGTSYQLCFLKEGKIDECVKN